MRAGARECSWFGCRATHQVLRQHAAQQQRVDARGDVGDQVGRRRHGALRVADAAEVEREEAAADVARVHLVVREPELVLLEVAADEDDVPRRELGPRRAARRAVGGGRRLLDHRVDQHAVRGAHGARRPAALKVAPSDARHLLERGVLLNRQLLQPHKLPGQPQHHLRRPAEDGADRRAGEVVDQVDDVARQLRGQDDQREQPRADGHEVLEHRVGSVDVFLRLLIG